MYPAGSRWYIIVINGCKSIMDLQALFSVVRNNIFNNIYRNIISYVDTSLFIMVDPIIINRCSRVRYLPTVWLPGTNAIQCISLEVFEKVQLRYPNVVNIPSGGIG